MIKGVVALMGSGELSATMVETHKELLLKKEGGSRILFIDTPAGFQENVDLLTRRAIDFFQQRVGQNMEAASFKSDRLTDTPEGEKTFRQLSEAGYVLIGPGSPTYAVNQLKNTPIPTLIGAMVTRGGCLVAASAAALTVGSHTLPVYEIYKVGEEPHWIQGLNILGALGLELVVIPHWNNAEGGNHDTRYCYMGETRFHLLEDQLPPQTTILGIDEHTACLLDFNSSRAYVEGIGKVTIRCSKEEVYYNRGDSFDFSRLSGNFIDSHTPVTAETKENEHPQAKDCIQGSLPFWKRMHSIEKAFHNSLEQNDTAGITTQLLEADSLLWKAQSDLENPEDISQGRELFREMIVLAGTSLDYSVAVLPQKFETLVTRLLDLREQYRKVKQWTEADQIREILHSAGVVLEDTHEGPRWYFLS